MCKTAEEAAWNALSTGADQQGLRVIAALIQEFGRHHVTFDFSRDYATKTLRMTAHMNLTISEELFIKFREQKAWAYGS